MKLANVSLAFDINSLLETNRMQSKMQLKQNLPTLHLVRQQRKAKKKMRRQRWRKMWMSCAKPLMVSYQIIATVFCEEEGCSFPLPLPPGCHSFPWQLPHFALNLLFQNVILFCFFFSLLAISQVFLQVWLPSPAGSNHFPGRVLSLGFIVWGEVPRGVWGHAPPRKCFEINMRWLQSCSFWDTILR